ncbi:hypothetical protein POM88_023413 [Heracleum sosnowskyi]|uniref:Pentatricopeptide repeat-containing protein n=1 Tax=Heracleum sosnowskyi TaxID=360622 RepID=A0AAD8IJE6_9APIA|nr:hypothetical protein POM88_023413 [Heracleum sosnowskyi]
MIDGYVRNGRINLVMGLFERMAKRNVVFWNTVVNALVKCGRIEDAERLFDEMPEKDVISWTAMVGGLARFGRIDDARRLFDRMLWLQGIHIMKDWIKRFICLRGCRRRMYLLGIL